MKNDMPKRKRLITFRDFIVFSIAVMLTMFFNVFHKLECEREWKLRWGKLAKERCDAIMERGGLEMRLDEEGTLFTTCSTTSLIVTVGVCSSNQVNNVWYVGSENGFDYFIHNSDFMTQRFRVPSGKLHPDYKSPKTSDVYRWKRVSSAPSLAASQIAAFLNGERLPHLAHRY